MNCPQRLTPLHTPAPTCKVLLAEHLSARLLRQLDGWTPQAAHALEFVDNRQALASLAGDSLDWAVLSISAAEFDELLPALLRVARQGLICRA